MRNKVDLFFDYAAKCHLVIVGLVCLFSRMIINLIGLDIDLHLSEANIAPSIVSGHVFGTDYLGRDVFALMLDGSKYSLSISVLSAVLGTMIGVVSGTLAGFFGDHKLRVTRASILVSLVLIPLAVHYLLLSSRLEVVDGIIFCLFVLMTAALTGYLSKSILKIFPWLGEGISIPLDFLNMKFIEILFAIPTYFVLLALSGIFDSSVHSLIIIIGITSWPRTALLIRTEMLKIREMDFIHSLKLAGIPWYQTLVRHAIPNAISPIIVNFVFFASGLLVVESTLSFIGIGLPGDIISWGKILAGFKHNSANWWTALFPGLVIFFTILAFHRVGRIIQSNKSI